jgi:Uma2 family endonuclease
MKLSVRAIKLTDEQFAQLCRENPELRLELTAERELVIMPPTGSETGRRNGEICYSLTAWAKKDGTGISLTMGRASAGSLIP